MTEKVLQEQVDKYRVEFSRGTTGGKIGFSVRAMGDDADKVLSEARMLAKKAVVGAQEIQVMEVKES